MADDTQVDEMEEILQDFIVETDELLDGLDQDLIELENSPEDPDLLNAVFRSFHTIKGAAGFLGLTQVVEVAHSAENVLNRLRQEELKLSPSIMDAVLKALDMLKLLISHVKEKDGAEEDLSPVISLLKSALEGGGSSLNASPEPMPAPAESEEPVSAQTEPVVPETAKTGEEKPPEPDNEKKETAAVEEKTQTAEKVEAVKEEVKAEETGKGVSASKKPKTTGIKNKKTREDGETIRVDINRLDDVMNLVGELVLGRNRLMRLSSLLEDRYGEDELVASLRETTYNLNVNTSDLQLAVMKIRMQPISKVFSKFPRMVRDLARERGKDVELVLKGQETEVDKTVIEEIGDPLVHLVRNAVDHGIDTPEERKKAGKPEKGILTLSAFHKGSNIFVCIEDDGRGMDIERIKEKAVEKGMASKEELERFSEKDLVNLIFQPGFSTAGKVTNVSGRGVGMDVVKTNISKLSGSIDIETTPGKGSKIILKLPLTLAIIQSLMVQIGREHYALPLSTVAEIIRVGELEMKTVEGREVVYVRDTVYPLLRLSSLLNSAEAEAGNRDSYAVIVALGEKKIALLVDGLLGQEEVVIKSMGDYLSDTRGLAGATITGDGRVILILDVAGLFENIKRAMAA